MAVTIRLPPSEDPAGFIYGYFYALWELDNWFNAEKLPLRDLDEHLYGCFCAMYFYKWASDTIDDASRILPHALSDFFHLRAVLAPMRPDVAMALERMCALTEEIPRHLWPAVHHEDFSKLWNTPHVDDRYAEALNALIAILKTDHQTDQAFWRQLEQYAALHWTCEVVSEEEYADWIAEQRVRISSKTTH